MVHFSKNEKITVKDYLNQVLSDIFKKEKSYKVLLIENELLTVERQTFINQ